MAEQIKTIEWIEEERVNSTERIKTKEAKRNELLQYIFSHPSATKKDIEKEFHLDLRTYFGKKILDEIKKENGLNIYSAPIYRGLLHESQYS